MLQICLTPSLGTSQWPVKAANPSTRAARALHCPLHFASLLSALSGLAGVALQGPADVSDEAAQCATICGDRGTVAGRWVALVGGQRSAADGSWIVVPSRCLRVCNILAGQQPHKTGDDAVPQTIGFLVAMALAECVTLGIYKIRLSRE